MSDSQEEFIMTNTNKLSTKTLVVGAILTALVFLLQYLGAFVRLGPFSISLVLIPIVIGAATCGVGIGAWLGFVFGAAVLLCGDAAAFMAVNVAGTIITVLAKGTLCGFLAGLTYKAVLKLAGAKRSLVAVMAAAVVCPVVNTGVFLLGCLAFFMPTIAEWTTAAGLGGNVAQYMIFGLVGGNFLVELAANIVFAPAIVHIIKAVKK